MSEIRTLVILGGGDAFDTEADYLAALADSRVRFFEDKTGWKTTLFRELSGTFEVLIPTLPKKDDAKHGEWKTVFEKFASGLDPASTAYVGHSLGGIFLAKYFSENPMRAAALHLVAAPFSRCGTFELGEDLSALAEAAEEFHLWHSKDDPVVDFAEMAAYEAAVPNAVPHVFEDRAHFNGERFDELAAELTKRKD